MRFDFEKSINFFKILNILYKTKLKLDFVNNIINDFFGFKYSFCSCPNGKIRIRYY